MATKRKWTPDEWAPWLRARLDMGDVGPFKRGEPDAIEPEYVVTIARDPSTPMSTGYVGRFLWSVRWPSKRTRFGHTSSLITAEQAIAGAIELGEPPV